MFLKRHYEPDALADWLAVRDAEVEPKIAGMVKSTGMTESAALKLLNNQYSDAHDPPEIAYIEVKHCGDAQNLNQGWVEKGIAEGWLAIADGKISIRTDDEPLVFVIRRGPGHYSCFDGSKLNGQDEAKAHVAQQDGESPDPQHPAGYVKQAYYQCVRENADG
ncbi:hypothetical protein LCGC14_3144790 [marine sediment metagenome]|uniref:Uncharacterized protein n=1 Tax=marine sediment metagenome TaxID=412755 RepID=A0A0F8WJU3_9ZZZZ